MKSHEVSKESQSFLLISIFSFAFSSTDLNFSLCMNKEYDSYGNEKGDCYIVESLRDEDCFSRSKSAYTVTHILSKGNDSASYTDLLFMDKSVTLNDLPAPALKMLDEQLMLFMHKILLYH
ncbi:hypothetical protein [Gemmiger sp.]